MRLKRVAFFIGRIEEDLIGGGKVYLEIHPNSKRGFGQKSIRVRVYRVKRSMRLGSRQNYFIIRNTENLTIQSIGEGTLISELYSLF